MKSVILGLVGPSGSGKTTVCNYLRGVYGFHRIHVATPIKLGFQEITGLGPHYCERPLIDEPAAALGGVTPRVILEHLGTRLHEIAPFALPMRAADRIRKLLGSRLDPPYILVDGLRRATEGEMIHDLGGQVIRMIGGDIDPDKPCDISQTEVFTDFTLRWSPTIDELHRQIDGIMAELPGIPNGRGQKDRQHSS